MHVRSLSLGQGLVSIDHAPAYAVIRCDAPLPLVLDGFEQLISKRLWLRVAGRWQVPNNIAVRKVDVRFCHLCQ